MTNFTKKTRRKKLSQFQSNRYKKIRIIFLNGLENIEENLKKRKNKKIPDEVLEKQIKGFELPGMDEFDEIHYCLKKEIQFN
jgi:gluconate kinase